jgi:hypothetical protein
MQVIDRIAERMRRVLVVADAVVPPSTGPIKEKKPEQSQSSQTLETIIVSTNISRDFEELNKCAGDLTELNNEIAELTTRAAPQLQQAKTSSEKLAVFNKLADEFAPIVEKYSDDSGVFQHYSREIDHKIQTILRATRRAPREQRTAAIARALASIKRFLQSSVKSMEALQRMYNNTDGMKGYSARLDKLLHRLESALVVILGNRGVHRGLLKELEDLGI